MKHRTVVFGLDGAHFELIEPWIESGVLPNIKKVVETGVSGDLQSVLPPVTSPNWKAYSTGKNPGKLGIFWWENIDVNDQTVYYPEERKTAHVEFWDILSEEMSTGVVGVPTTFPPKQIDPFFIAGPPDADESGYVHPPSLESEIEEQFNHRLHPNHRCDTTPDLAGEEILDIIDTRFEVAAHLADQYDVQFLQVTTFYLNVLQHHFWDGEYTKRAWKTIDDHLGNYLDEDTNVVLMSDHGSTPIDTVFHINSWLEDEGYLVLDSALTDLLHRIGLTKDRLLSISSRAGLLEAISQIAPKKLIDRIPDSSGQVPREAKTDLIDWEKSTVVASGQGPIYLTEQIDKGSREDVISSLINGLENMSDEKGRPIVDAVHRGNNIYSGPYLSDSPDLVIEQRPGVHIPGTVGSLDIFSSPDTWVAENKRQGLFAAAGPDFTAGNIELSILDLAPTLLHLHNCPIPWNMDGDVKTEVFNADSRPARKDPVYEEFDYSGSGSNRANDSVQKRLEQLGYLE
jgi:predicted AlkP superfamily phosphohydrolase/phosphomutase